MRIATWNLKQAVAPKQPLDQLWNWAATTIRHYHPNRFLRNQHRQHRPRHQSNKEKFQKYHIDGLRHQHRQRLKSQLLLHLYQLRQRRHRHRRHTLQIAKCRYRLHFRNLLRHRY